MLSTGLHFASESTVSDLGSTQLKNIAEPVRVYALEVGSPTRANAARHAHTAPPEKQVGPPAAPESLQSRFWHSRT
jgi:hypothetical protein